MFSFLKEKTKVGLIILGTEKFKSQEYKVGEIKINSLYTTTMGLAFSKNYYKQNSKCAAID